MHIYVIQEIITMIMLTPSSERIFNPIRCTDCSMYLEMVDLARTAIISPRLSDNSDRLSDNYVHQSDRSKLDHILFMHTNAIIIYI